MDRLSEIERRLAALEAAQEAAPIVPGAGTFWVLDALRDRVPPPSPNAGDRPGGAGEIVFGGVVDVPAGHAEWQYGQGVEALLDTDWSPAAAVLGALGSPVRLHLLQLVLSGSTEASELAADDQVGTTGQVYHHLRALVSAGWLRSSRRGAYEIPPERVVPLLVVLAAGLA